MARRRPKPCARPRAKPSPSATRTTAAFEEVVSGLLRAGDVIYVEASHYIAGDGEVIEGVASVDESAITGESAPVIREAGGDRSAVTGGTKVLSDWIKVKITSNPGETFLDRMIALVEGAERQKTPNEIALSILLSGLTIIFLLAVVTLQPFAIYSNAPQTVFVLVSLLVCLIPTTIGGLLSAIGIAGMDRLVQYNVLAMSGRAVEAAGDVNTLLLDKTGTITLGNRQATEFIPAPDVSHERLANAAQLASLSDETPEGRSIVVLAKEKYNLRGRDLAGIHAEFVPFTAQTRMSGVNLPGTRIRKGSVDAIARFLEEQGSALPQKVREAVEDIARAGGTPLVVAENASALGVIHLKDIVKGGLKDRLARLRAMGIRTIMITGDNPLTAAVIAREAGVDDFLAEAKPKDKMDLIKREQGQGKLVAMTGDGTNDAPALAQADVGVAMNSGTQAAKEAGNMVDLDSNPTKLIEIVEIGKQLLMTRGALTTFSIANDVAKYFAIIPAMFAGVFPSSACSTSCTCIRRSRPSSPRSSSTPSLSWRSFLWRSKASNINPRPPTSCCATTCSSTASAALLSRSSASRPSTSASSPCTWLHEVRLPLPALRPTELCSLLRPRLQIHPQPPDRNESAPSRTFGAKSEQRIANSE